ncbi:NAD(P)H-dependent glycerol-3-phosphate dehydrogenase [Rickettsia canadensis str. CA410]|uniref:NAD(P)H-dependent glycerol-3-phosphate dehydrogenase n=1 Tax=Rickettsia canadensis str. CA410 TaxID=1105107 RepID=A0ABM5MRQ5_RICCA|nr:NAD(P)H-dependent glycerol-3-phosphate dehydrogenase [Rickettsia canadensis str. CA410]
MPVILINYFSIKSYYRITAIAFLSSLNLAKELAKNLLASASIASLDIDVANKIANNLGSKIFTTNVTSDIVTLQVVETLKNIFAIKSRIDLAKK